MRKKEVKTTYFSPRTVKVWYADGTVGLRYVPDGPVSESDEIPDQTSHASPMQWNQQQKNEAPASDKELHDIESALESQRQRMSEEYGRDQHFRAYSNDMEDLEKLSGPEEAARFEELSKKYPDYIHPLEDGQMSESGYALPQKKENK